MKKRRRRRDRRKSRRIVWWTILILLLLTWVLYRYVFVIRQVYVEGEFTESAEDVIRAAKVDFGKFIGHADQDRYAEGIARLGTVVLEKMSVELPNTLVFKVSNRTQDALYIAGGNTLVLDSDGYVVKVYPQMPESDLPYIVGLDVRQYRLGERVEANDTRLENMKLILDALRRKDAIGLITQIYLSDAQNLQLLSGSGIYITLGDSENMESKITWMRAAVLDLERRGETTGRLDVSSGSKADFRKEG